jgi:hypothetical protein
MTGTNDAQVLRGRSLVDRARAQVITPRPQELRFEAVLNEPLATRFQTSHARSARERAGSASRKTRVGVKVAKLLETRPLLDWDSPDDSVRALPIRPKDHRFSVGDRGTPIRKGTRQVWLVRHQDRVAESRRLGDART